ncbi:MAG: glutamate--tRNA ligase [Alphaproteobacteria bacterium]|jgi:glutamyl-tRNA synthetase|nr:glutamate--tRNA ligase [Rhodospirillaceae bacterium]MBT6509409.1 glutamate--tRNA ligase [Rhodospirillaceae bacterium]MBT7646090.1 glutamate--tRNA ligase [Rhodospirillaceae bacterium]MDG2480269.1 glutamate--tRNA ligase [Alphaproteobacteria bacterium]
MTVVTRFAPSPTGFLHIGGARTALYNWLYARHTGGTFLLRIEDTDRKRSTDAAIEAIFDSLRWLGLDWDGEPLFQFARAERHAEVAQALIAAGKAYPCYCTPDELTAMREKARAEGRPVRYDGTWRDRDPADAPAGASPAIRLKSPQEGETVIRDLVQGDVTIANAQLDDMILLRSDGTPTYMLAVVVDDHDMGVSHVIRGDDHLTNAARQIQLFEAMDWPSPTFAHIPLIHGPDGAKMSKRQGAVGAEAYRDMGFLPEAMQNYLLRLGWGHGDDEIIPLEQAVAWFDLSGVGKSPARFDMDKLTALNLHYMKQADDQRLARLTAVHLEEVIGRPLGDDDIAVLARAMPSMKERAKTLVELAQNATFLFRPRPLEFDAKASKILNPDTSALLLDLQPHLAALDGWSADVLEAAVRAFAEERELGLGKVAQPLRAALTGGTVSPPIFDVLDVFGRDESLARLDDAVARFS